MSESLLTARELAEMLLPYGDLPVKLRTEEHDRSGFCCITLVRKDAIDLGRRNQQSTDYGDLDLVRITIRVIDNA